MPRPAPRDIHPGGWALAIGASAWVAILFLAPAALFPVGRFICHQRPERSFFVHGQQMAVCARCTGLYVGAAVAGPLALFAAASVASARARVILMLAALPTAVTWTLEFAGLAYLSNTIRFIAALPLGFAAAWLVLGLMAPGSRSHREARNDHQDHGEASSSS